MHRVDTHIITLQGWSGQREDWYEKCLASLEDQPTNIHVIEGVQGHIGKGRAAGFATGSAEFVSFADPDDYLEPDAVQTVVDFLDANPNIDVCCTSENVITEEGEFTTSSMHHKLYKSFNYRSLLHMHHLVVARREAIEPYLDFIAERPNHCEFALWFEMYKDGKGFELLEYIGYNWRMHENPASKSIPVLEEHAREMQRVFNELRACSIAV